jgi:hypothetical protein
MRSILVVRDRGTGPTGLHEAGSRVTSRLYGHCYTGDRGGQMQSESRALLASLRDPDVERVSAQVGESIAQMSERLSLSVTSQEVV